MKAAWEDAAAAALSLVFLALLLVTSQIPALIRMTVALNPGAGAVFARCILAIFYVMVWGMLVSLGRLLTDALPPRWAPRPPDFVGAAAHTVGDVAWGAMVYGCVFTAVFPLVVYVTRAYALHGGRAPGTLGLDLLLWAVGVLIVLLELRAARSGRTPAVSWALWALCAGLLGLTWRV